MAYNTRLLKGLAIKILKPFIVETTKEMTTCSNTECSAHGNDFGSDCKFCFHCGSPIKESEVVTRKKTTDIFEILDKKYSNEKDGILTANIGYTDATIYYFNDYTCVMFDDDEGHDYEPMTPNELKEIENSYKNDANVQSVVRELSELIGYDGFELFYGTFSEMW